MSEEENIREDAVPVPETEAIAETDPVEKMNCQSCKTEMDVSGIPSFSEIKCPVCGALNTVQAKLGHFTLLKVIGSGGMGTVFLAQDDNLGRKVAIKVMKKSLGDNSELFEIFRNEAQSAARLNHPHVAQIYSFGMEKGLPYLEMEYVSGSSLDSMIASGMKLDPAFVLRVGMEIAEGLKTAEEAGLFHGDIKPDNILFDENMQAKLVDFGIASMASQGQSDELWGTPYYIAPEKVQKKKNSARSDIYSLGATLYHAIAGQPPYEGEDAVAVIKARFKGPPKPLEQIRPDVEPEVSRIISRMMYNDLFMRYPNYNSLINDIKTYLAQVPESRKAGPQFGLGRRTTVNSNGTAQYETETGEFEPLSKKSGKKLVIHKGAMTIAASMPSISPAGQTPNSEESASTPEPQRRKEVNVAKVMFITFSIVILLVILGGVAGLLMMFTSKRDAAQTAARNEQQLKDVEGKFFALEEKLPTVLDRMKRCDGDMTNVFASLDRIYMSAVNLHVKIPDLEPPPEPAAESSEPSAEGGAGAQAEKEVQIPVELITKAEATLKATGVASPTPEQVAVLAKALMAGASQTNAAETAAAEPGAAQSAGNPDAAAQIAEVPEPAEELSTEQKRAMELDKKAEEYIYVHARKIRRYLRECESIASEEVPAFNPFSGKPSPAQVLAALKEREALYAAREEAISGIEFRAEESAKLLKEMQRGLVRLDGFAKRFIEERNRLAEEAKIAAENERKASEERIAEARRKAAGEEEANRVKQVLGEKEEYIDKFDYAKVISDMERMIPELRTPEGKEELKWTIERFKGLISLREFLIKDLSQNTGLRRGFRGQDVTGVSPDGNNLLIATGREVPVSELVLGDWSRLVYGILGPSRDQNRPIGYNDKGTQQFNAAVFFYVHGKGAPDAEKAAREFAKMAMKSRTALRSDARKLIPILEDSDFPSLFETE